MMSSFVTLIAVPAGGQLADLRRLLKALASEYAPRQDVRLLVADNTPDGAARTVFDECCMRFQDRADYIHEPHRGYSNVRNAIIGKVGDAAAIAMIDDDEVPAPGWLDNLWAARQRSSADVVVGPVIPEFPAGTPAWYVRSGIFGLDTPWFPEEGEMPWCATNNTLMLTDVLQRVPEGFDPKFQLSGGEDTHFFRRARSRGCKIVWTHTAVVHEFLSPSRVTCHAIFRRAIRVGNTRTLIEFELVGGWRIRITRALKIVGIVCLGLGCTLGAIVRRDRALALRGVRRLGLAYGMILAFTNSEPWRP